MKAVAIDGPSGAGKSTLARAVAQRLGYIYVDTGALYRAVGNYALSCGVDPSNEQQVTGLLPDLRVDIRYTDGTQRVLVNGTDALDSLRTPAVSMAASAVSAFPSVRAFLFETQRQISRNHNVVMDGRDIGTVVLPNADAKIFLTASAEERAHRRHKELAEKGIDIDFETVLHDLKDRDHNDSTRAVAPLKPALDSITLDTTDLSFTQSIEELLTIISRKLDRPNEVNERP